MAGSCGHVARSGTVLLYSALWYFRVEAEAASTAATVCSHEAVGGVHTEIPCIQIAQLQQLAQLQQYKIYER
jgi:hypothetical protein